MQLRRSLRRIRPLRRAYYWLRSALTKPANPLAIRLVDEARFRETVRTLMECRADVGDYLEFGVYNGTTLATVWDVFRELGLTQPHFYGFDSFAGLPDVAEEEVEGGLWFAGQCACPIEVTTTFLQSRGVDWSRVHLVQGWFNKTLTAETRQIYAMRRASLMMVDCDLYTSALAALRFSAPLIRDEAIVIFDDWGGFQADEQGLGEKKAFDEFMREHPEFRATELDVSYSDEAKIFRFERKGERA